jgi:PEGA domain-containing protein
MNRTLRLLIGSLCALNLLIATACSPASTSNATNQNASNANAAQSKPINSNSPAAAKQSTGASIEVTSAPPGAGVTLIPTSEAGAGSPQSYGLTPTTITNLAPGDYTVHLEKTGYKYFQKEVKLKENATVKVNAALKK